MKNCYTWANEQIASHGGERISTWSDNWFVHWHVVWVKPDGTMWSYVPDDKSYLSMWRFIVDGGWTFKGHTTEHVTCVRFSDGLKAAIITELKLISVSLRALAAKIKSSTQGGKPGAI